MWELPFQDLHAKVGCEIMKLGKLPQNTAPAKQTTHRALPSKYILRAAKRLMHRTCTQSEAAVPTRENSVDTPSSDGRNCGFMPPVRGIRTTCFNNHSLGKLYAGSACRHDNALAVTGALQTHAAHLPCPLESYRAGGGPASRAATTRPASACTRARAERTRAPAA